MAQSQENSNLFQDVGFVDPQGNAITDNQQQNGQEQATNQVQLYEIVHKKHTMSSDGTVHGFVYSLGGNDVGCQLIRKYSRWNLHVGPFKRSMASGNYMPATYNSDSWLAKKGVVMLSPDNIQALEQVMPVVKEELAVLESKVSMQLQ